MAADVTVEEMARLAAQIRDDYAWFLVQVEQMQHHWDDPSVIIGHQTMTRAESVLEMARNRFRYQREDNASAFDAMRAFVPPQE